MTLEQAIQQAQKETTTLQENVTIVKTLVINLKEAKAQAFVTAETEKKEQIKQARLEWVADIKSTMKTLGTIGQTASNPNLPLITAKLAAYEKLISDVENTGDDKTGEITKNRKDIVEQINALQGIIATDTTTSATEKAAADTALKSATAATENLKSEMTEARNTCEESKNEAAEQVRIITQNIQEVNATLLSLENPPAVNVASDTASTTAADTSATAAATAATAAAPSEQPQQADLEMKRVLAANPANVAEPRLRSRANTAGPPPAILDGGRKRKSKRRKSRISRRRKSRRTRRRKSRRTRRRKSRTRRKGKH